MPLNIKWPSSLSFAGVSVWAPLLGLWTCERFSFKSDSSASWMCCHWVFLEEPRTRCCWKKKLCRIIYKAEDVMISGSYVTQELLGGQSHQPWVFISNANRSCRVLGDLSIFADMEPESLDSRFRSILATDWLHLTVSGAWEKDNLPTYTSLWFLILSLVSGNIKIRTFYMFFFWALF